MTLQIDPRGADAAVRALDHAAGQTTDVGGRVAAIGRATQLDDWCVPLAHRTLGCAALLERIAAVLGVRASLARAADSGIDVHLSDPQLFDLAQALVGLAGTTGQTSAATSLVDWFDGLVGSGEEVAADLFGWLDEMFEPVDPNDPGVAGGPHFVLGSPTRPYIRWDEDFVYDSSSAGLRDQWLRAKWQGMLAGGRLLRGDLDDATQMYRHYWDNNGEPIEFDYEEAAVEDEGVRNSVDFEIARAAEWAETYAANGETDFSMTGDASVSTDYPHTENWQKAIGGHQLWSSADVRVDGDTIEMTITVHAEDYYNFNRGQADIATDASDDENGRFTELGWAQPFPSSGTVERTVTWEIGSIEQLDTTSIGEPERNPGREDNEIERDAGSPDRTSIPDNNRDTGGPRVDG